MSTLIEAAKAIVDGYDGIGKRPVSWDALIYDLRWAIAAESEPHGHGFTCGWCDWGRDTYRDINEYYTHVGETEHYGEKKG